MIVRRVFLIGCMIALTQCQTPQMGGSLDDLIGSVFNPGNDGDGGNDLSGVLNPIGGGGINPVGVGGLNPGVGSTVNPFDQGGGSGINPIGGGGGINPIGGGGGFNQGGGSGINPIGGGGGFNQGGGSGINPIGGGGGFNQGGGGGINPIGGGGGFNQGGGSGINPIGGGGGFNQGGGGGISPNGGGGFNQGGGGGINPGGTGMRPGGGGGINPGGTGMRPGGGINPGVGGGINPGGTGMRPGSGGLNPAGGNPCEFGAECVPYFQCANGTIITDGDGLLDIRLGEDNPEAHPCSGLFETCCSLRRTEPQPRPDTFINEGCGFRNADGVGFRITGNKDNEAQFGEFPWAVAILKEEKALNNILNVFQCGGSLIHPSVVLTAAHCVSGKDPLSLKIRAGEWDTQTKDEIFPHQDRPVNELIIHEQYYKGGLFNDIALLFLAEPVTIAENVNTVCLPPQDMLFDRNRCFASGWGKDLFGKEGKYQVILKRVELPVVPRGLCLNELRQTRLGKYFELHNSFICAGGERGRDTCKGDGGSPLVCPIPGAVGRYYQSGIVSWGIGCGDLTPGVYANVALFRNWIDEKFRMKNLDGRSYRNL